MQGSDSAVMTLQARQPSQLILRVLVEVHHLVKAPQSQKSLSLAYLDGSDVLLDVFSEGETMGLFHP